MMNENQKFREEIKFDFPDGLAGLKRRQVVVADRAGKVHLKLSLVGAICTFFVPVLPAIVGLQVLLSKRTVTVVRQTDE